MTWQILQSFDFSILNYNNNIHSTYFEISINIIHPEMAEIL